MSNGDKCVCGDKETWHKECYAEQAEASGLSGGLCAERKARAFDFIQEHATRIHFDEACDSLIYSDKDHFTKDDWLLKAIEKAST